MLITGGKLISSQEAKALLAPVLARHMAPRDLQIALDDELNFADEYDRSGVLLLPDGAAIDGDLALDYECAEYDGKSFRGVLALGSLAVHGGILNANVDGGPFLAVLGPLTVRHIIKGGAPLIAAGPIISAGTIYCEYNHGSFRAWGGITAQVIVIDDQSYDISGPVSGIKVVLWQDDATQYLLPEFFYENDDGTLEANDDLSETLKARIRAGEPIFRDDALGI